MAIVETYQLAGGTVYVDDDCYRDVPPEEMARRLDRVQKKAWEILQRRAKDGKTDLEGRGV